jgi:hypothetical protein
MSIFAEISGGAVTNVAVAAAAAQLPAGAWAQIDALTPMPGIGWGATETSGAWTFTAPIAPALTLAQQAAAALAAGLAITSTATASLDATYPADPNTVSYVNSELNAILLNGTFADGATAIQWPDTTGALHTFTVAQFKTFAAALGTFVSGIRKCVIGAVGAALPSASDTIP